MREWLKEFLGQSRKKHTFGVVTISLFGVLIYLFFRLLTKENITGQDLLLYTVVIGNWNWVVKEIALYLVPEPEGF
jgi:hypothetical protein